MKFCLFIYIFFPSQIFYLNTLQIKIKHKYLKICKNKMILILSGMGKERLEQK